METDENTQPQEDNNEDIDFDELEANEPEGETMDWEAEAKKFKAIAERARKKLDSFEKNPTQENKPEPKKEEEQSPFQTMKEIALVTKNLDSDELDELELQAKELGVDPVILARKTVWKTHLESFRSAKQKSQGTPAPSGRSRVVKSLKFAEAVSSDKATESEKQAAFEAARDEALGR